MESGVELFLAQNTYKSESYDYDINNLVKDILGMENFNSSFEDIKKMQA